MRIVISSFIFEVEMQKSGSSELYSMLDFEQSVREMRLNGQSCRLP